MVAGLGERGFLRVYEVITMAAFAWLIIAYRLAPTKGVGVAPATLKLAIAPIMLLAFILVVGGITTPNPGIVGSAHLLDQREVVRGILRVTRNAFFWGVGLWGLVHMAANGDLASVLMFGTI